MQVKLTLIQLNLQKPLNFKKCQLLTLQEEEKQLLHVST